MLSIDEGFDSTWSETFFSHNLRVALGTKENLLISSIKRRRQNPLYLQTSLFQLFKGNIFIFLNDQKICLV